MALPLAALRTGSVTFFLFVWLIALWMNCFENCSETTIMVLNFFMMPDRHGFFSFFFLIKDVFRIEQNLKTQGLVITGLNHTIYIYIHPLDYFELINGYSLLQFPGKQIFFRI